MQETLEMVEEDVARELINARITVFHSVTLPGSVENDE